ncbi:hypothetical protein NEMBOFW57_006956 [Staphylotrichum longicolle]|uniref:Uncharacterized protein n=1 Tax=Staphylotrichum longicolle TaxID=669026 RepID=A0AAD4HYJ9_9PEZI|nr:hypothetical protein NEMBOFW57_006956 [Staphylotrichum longicolle]
MHFSREHNGRNHRTGLTDVDISASLGFSVLGADSDHHRQHGQEYAGASTTSTTAGGNTSGSFTPAALHDSAARGATITPSVTTPLRGTETADDISQPIASLLAEFSSSVFQSQAEIAGISSAVADYIAWMRRVPKGNAPPNTSLVYVNVLEAVESRLREMREIAQTRPRAAFRDMVAALQTLGPAGASVCDSLGQLEEVFERQSAEVASFFQTRYNACAALTEQTQNIDRAPSFKKRPGGESGDSSQRPP